MFGSPNIALTSEREVLFGTKSFARSVIGVINSIYCVEVQPVIIELVMIIMSKDLIVNFILSYLQF